MKRLEEIKARASMATPGPAEKYLDNEGFWHLRFPLILRGFHGGKYGWKTYASEPDVEFEIHARTDIPRLVVALELVEECLWAWIPDEMKTREIGRIKKQIESILNGEGEK